MKRFGFVQPPHATLAILALSTCLVSAQGGQTPPPPQPPARRAGPQPQGRGNQAPPPPMSFLHHQHAHRQRREPRRVGWRRRTLSDAGDRGWRREPGVAGLSEHAGRGRRECAGPDRQGAVGQRERAVGRARPRAPARRHARPRAHGQHVDARHGAQRKGRTGAGRAVPGRSGARAGERARHPHRLATRRPRVIPTPPITPATTGRARTQAPPRSGTTIARAGPGTSWNSVHASKGCSQPALVSTGGAGLLYCFATGETK